MAIIPIILNGGVGKRLWPVSRKSKPKQFFRFANDDYSLFQKTLLRCRNEIFDDTPIIVSADDQRFLVASDCKEIDLRCDILLEPVARNTCPAIAAGCIHALARNKDALVLVLSADHAIPDTKAFRQAVARASDAALSGRIITFGVKPDKPATGYGYIQPGKRIGDTACFDVKTFIEKPDRDKAEKLVEDGCLWNSGNFMFSASHFISELQYNSPDILKHVSMAYEHAECDLDFLRLNADEFSNSPSVSVDYAIMEKTTNAAVMPVNYHWSDLGTWEAVYQDMKKTTEGNGVIGNATCFSSTNNLVYSTDRLTALCGVDNLIIISTPDALLVASADQSQNIKQVVTGLEELGHKEAMQTTQVFRPWGNHTSLDMNAGYQVKRIVVSAGGILSLQRHHHRAEHWIVVRGSVEATIGDEVHQLSANQSIYVPLGAIHRLVNNTNEDAILIEVQTGDYLGEDDIIRLEDAYNRDE